MTRTRSKNNSSGLSFPIDRTEALRYTLLMVNANAVAAANDPLVYPLTKVSIAERADGNGWVVTYRNGADSFHETAIAALQEVQEASRRVVDGLGLSVVVSTIEWAPHTAVGRVVVNAITGKAKR